MSVFFQFCFQFVSSCDNYKFHIIYSLFFYSRVSDHTNYFRNAGSDISAKFLCKVTNLTHSSTRFTFFVALIKGSVLICFLSWTLFMSRFHCIDLCYIHLLQAYNHYDVSTLNAVPYYSHGLFTIKNILIKWFQFFLQKIKFWLTFF